jgi:hypothetical protein
MVEQESLFSGSARWQSSGRATAPGAIGNRQRISSAREIASALFTG